MRTAWLAALVCAGAGLAALAEGAPKIQFDRLVYDFGKTGQVETVTGTFKYTNEGDAVLKIKQPHATCGCTVASLDPDTLAPGESGELAFTLSLGQTRTVLEKHINVSSNDPKTPEVSLVIKADYTPLFEVTPMLLAPILPRNGKATNLVVSLARTDGQPLRIRRLAPSQPWITATLEPAGKEKAKANIRVDVRADGPPRRFSEYVHIYDVDRTNAPVTMIYVYGQVLGDLSLAPEAMYWNITEPAKVKSEPLEAVVTRRVTVRAVDGKPFALKNPRSTLADLKVELTPKEGGAAYELVATLGSAPAQSLAGNVTFDTSVATQPRVEVPFIINVAKP